MLNIQMGMHSKEVIYKEFYKSVWKRYHHRERKDKGQAHLIKNE